MDAVKETLQRRDTVQIEYEVAVDELNKKRNEKEQVLICLGFSVLYLSVSLDFEYLFCLSAC